MRPDAQERLREAIARQDAERGRPLTGREKMENLARWLFDDPTEQEAFISWAMVKWSDEPEEAA